MPCEEADFEGSGYSVRGAWHGSPRSRRARGSHRVGEGSTTLCVFRLAVGVGTPRHARELPDERDGQLRVSAHQTLEPCGGITRSVARSAATAVAE